MDFTSNGLDLPADNPSVHWTYIHQRLSAGWWLCVSQANQSYHQSKVYHLTYLYFAYFTLIPSTMSLRVKKKKCIHLNVLEKLEFSSKLEGRRSVVVICFVPHPNTQQWTSPVTGKSILHLVR